MDYFTKPRVTPGAFLCPNIFKVHKKKKTNYPFVRQLCIPLHIYNSNFPNI